MAVKDSVLKELQKNKETYVSGEMLSDQLGVSRAAVWKAINSLRSEGYPIDAVTNKGYILSSGASVITAEALRRALPAKLRNGNYLIYDVIDSSNLQAKRLLLEDPDKVKHGDVVIARQQTAGRGRLGRGFFSPEEGLYLSIIIKPDFDMSRSVLVTVAAAVAVAEAIDEVCFHGEDAKAAASSKANSQDATKRKMPQGETRIKWVNDIYVKNRKVCGILTEAMTDFETGSIDSLVIGIGINTSTAGFPEELRSIAGAVGKGGLLQDASQDGDTSQGGTPLTAGELAQLAAAVIEKTLQYVQHISETDSLDAGAPEFIDCYRKKSLLTGRDVKVYKGTYRKDITSELGGRPARVLGISDAGGLQVIYSDGTRETLTSGEVSIRLDH